MLSRRPAVRRETLTPTLTPTPVPHGADRCPAVTLRVYSHVTPTMQREAAQVMDAACRAWPDLSRSSRRDLTLSG